MVTERSISYCYLKNFKGRFSSLHDSHGHQGKDRTAELVKRRCYWPGMVRDVERWCKECQRCILAKAVQPKVRSFMGTLQASRPHEILAVDFTVLEPSAFRPRAKF